MRWTPVMLLMCGGWLAGCGTPEDTGIECEGQHDMYLHGYESLGTASWDGVAFDLRSRECGYPDLTGEEAVSIVDADGQTFELEPMDACSDRWVAPDGLPQGSYVSVFAHDVDHGPEGVRDVELPLPLAHRVDGWGLHEDFDASELEGKAFLLDIETVRGCSAAADLLPVYLPDRVWLELTEVDGEQVRFRLVQELDRDNHHACVYLEDEANLSATGELLWERDQLDLAMDPAVESWDNSLRLGLSANAEGAAGLELTATVDLLNVVAVNTNASDTAEEPTWEDTCDLLRGFGIDCEACPGSGRESCLDLRFFAAEAPLDDMPYDSDPLISCEVEMDLEYEGCDLGCSATPRRQLPWLVLGFMGLIGLRRRRRA
jgi:hypothetical protein